MGLALYQTEPTFQKQIVRCAEILKPHLKRDLRQILYPNNPTQQSEAEQQLQRTAIAQPALFSVEYALAQLCLAQFTA